MDQLKLFGRLVLVSGQPVGFIYGELRTKMAVVRFMKADRSIKGIYPFLFQDFAKNLPDDTEWVNLEEDFDIPGLRRAKSSYDPDLMVLKWQVSY